MTDLLEPPEFALLGGPLHRLGIRLGLVRHRTNTVPLGIAIGVLLWGVAMALALYEGVAERLFSLTVVGGHVRFLLAVPLLFFCESTVVPLMASFVAGLRSARIVEGDGAPALDAEVRRTARLGDSWIAELCCLAAAVSAAHWAHAVGFVGASTVRNPKGPAAEAVLSGWWYWSVCLPVFRFLVFRWIWRLVLWWSFLRRLSAVDLRLVAMHPDGAGGMGQLETVQTQFSPLVVAISLVLSASYAEEIAAGRMELDATIPNVALLLVIDVALFIGPMLLFTPKLRACRLRWLGRYTVFASHYVRRFDEKWLGGNSEPAEELLGCGDIQSLADLGASSDRVWSMRSVLVSQRMLVQLVAAAVLPMLPLLLFRYPILNLLENVLRSLTGM